MCSTNVVYSAVEGWQADMSVFNWLGSPQGHVAVLDLIIVGGMVFDKAWLPWAEHTTIAALSVALVELGQHDADAGWRIASLILLLIVGSIAALLHIRTGEIVALATLAVLLVVIGPPLGGGKT